MSENNIKPPHAGGQAHPEPVCPHGAGRSCPLCYQPLTGAVAATLPPPRAAGPLATGKAAPWESPPETGELSRRCVTGAELDFALAQIRVLETMIHEHCQRQADVHGLTTGPTADRLAALEARVSTVETTYGEEIDVRLATLEAWARSGTTPDGFPMECANPTCGHGIRWGDYCPSGCDMSPANQECGLPGCEVHGTEEKTHARTREMLDMIRQRDDVTDAANQWKARAEKAEAQIASLCPSHREAANADYGDKCIGCALQDEIQARTAELMQSNQKIEGSLTCETCGVPIVGAPRLKVIGLYCSVECLDGAVTRLEKAGRKSCVACAKPVEPRIMCLACEPDSRPPRPRVVEPHPDCPVCGGTMMMVETGFGCWHYRGCGKPKSEIRFGDPWPEAPKREEHGTP